MRSKFLIVAFSILLPELLAAVEAFNLGRVEITAPQINNFTGTSDQAPFQLTANDIQNHNITTVGDAANFIPGVTTLTNSRNEQIIYVRGFDPRQVPMYIDGIPVYVPYDGYVDFGRFDTNDLASIQVAKGTSSASYGPNTLGGGINLITQKPNKKFEGYTKIGIGNNNNQQASVGIGTKFEKWYAKLNASTRKIDSFRMSSNFKPTSTEDGEDRENSYTEDNKFSAKLGYTPKDTDEYSISYSKQEGRKGQPPSTDPEVARFWKWPMWDKESVNILSQTKLSEYEQAKLKLYSDKFDNQIDSYTDDTYKTLKTFGKGSVSTGHSIYDDYTYGGSVEILTTRIQNNNLKAIGSFKSDRHKEIDGNDIKTNDYKDHIQSIALEDNLGITDQSLLTTSIAYHSLTPKEVYVKNALFELPETQTALDPQIIYTYNLSDSKIIYSSFAQKTRLPTLKDRYSIRLGKYIENPELAAEKSYNYEIGHHGTYFQNLEFNFAVFWNDLKDKIQSVDLNSDNNCDVGTECQMQNVGKVRIQGVELQASKQMNGIVTLDSNFIWMNIKNLQNTATKTTGIPSAKLLLSSKFKVSDNINLIASAEHNRGRWSSDTVKLDGHTLFNAKATWKTSSHLMVEASVNNITDKSYELEDGFPQAGRSWFTDLVYTF